MEKDWKEWISQEKQEATHLVEEYKAWMYETDENSKNL